ncbi:hypothetical protein CANTEDRAFT_101756 [Yamadazyma tenuis ATCC 10573]|uniref:Mediator of RNA polymerase II transcription subunit 13 n=1 Tax=Candida tenuis (strain ATCC 10573 / BCRC 21748 / CBS 615 / JCM 9827 / NBRC 10315 / NRRL Y-1498 / VKM Y-70) TaxID=590646 RepID=G3AYF9_CANTC|nr:uncharacterized protein CANTEDRAFT_101756 [Yamadazyma tenuis ATCC 10573]EGV65843.1 hypothetical protein CANTEDRAFT_101756 [Yamadazyma tenuis ATCC 10573]
MEGINASKVNTNYYKFGHITGVKYASYQLNTNNDQALLELELAIRYKYPSILITYYNKGLYYFQFEHNSNSIDLSKEYPELVLKTTKSISVELLCASPKPSQNQTQSTPSNNQCNDSASSENGMASAQSISEHSPYISVSLLKSIKKLILYRLSQEGSARIFGNSAVISIDEVTNHVIFIEPMISTNGDLLLCVIQKSALQLYDSSVLSIDAPEDELSPNFIIYLTPSGIRCHLFDNFKVLNSFTYTPPKNHENVLSLLKLATGIDLSIEPNLLWVKLIPNLQHLNNQTSKIAKFIHTVDNKKYIMWPWKLCLLQFGRYERSIDFESDSLANAEYSNQEIKYSDPLGLISEFMDFSIATKQQMQQNHQHLQNTGTIHNISTFNAPSVMSTGMSSAEHKNDLQMENNEIQMIPDLFEGIPHPVGVDFFDEKMMGNITELDDDRDIGMEDTSMISEDKNGLPDEGNDEMDDLFGGYSGSEDTDGKDETKQESDDNNLGLIENESKKDNVEDILKSSIDDLSFSGEDDLFNGRSSKLSFSNESTTFDIPKDQMAISLKDSTPYDDPGAPLPIMPTPMIPPPFDKSKVNPVSAGIDSDVAISQSAFSPILFNPLIKSNVDDKYGKGGKFYYNQNSETPIKKLRATSVIGLDLRSSGTFESPDRKGLGIEYLPESKVFFDSEEDEKIQEGEEDVPQGGTIAHSRRGEVEGNDDEEESVDGGPGEGDDDDIDDDDDDDDEEEESDEDADINLGKDSPLRLNMQSEPLQFQNPTGVPSVREPPGTVKTSHLLNTNTFNSGGFSSPLSTTLFTQSTKLNALPKFDSPFAIHDSPLDEKNKYNSPLTMDNDEFKRQTPISMPSTSVPTMNPTADGSSSNESTANSISESSNCLPLILRGVNIATIPDEFLLNNIMGAIKMSATASDFNMDVDQDEEDTEVSKKNEMVIKVDYLNEFLNWLGPNLIFDLGLNNIRKNLTSNIPQPFKDYQPKDNSRLIECELIPEKFEKVLMDAFPFTYKIKLEELLSDISELKDKEEYSMDNQLSFLDDITNDEILNPKSKLRKLGTIEWDSIYLDNPRNDEGFKEYAQVMKEISEMSLLDVSESIKTLNENKIRVLKNKSDIINLNSISIRFWKYLNFDPIFGPKNFQILMISETLNDNSNNTYNQDFIDSLIYNYNDCNFGNISKVSLQTIEARPDLESINNGLLSINKNDDNYNHIYRQMNKKLNSLAELIQLDLINKTNRFEFDRPLLLMFINFNKNFNSLVEISKICRNFKTFLKRHQLPLVQVFSKIIPSEHIIREINGQRVLKHTSNYMLTKLAMNLYNQCPNPIKTIGPNNIVDTSLNLFTNIVKEPVSKLNFKFFNNNASNKDTSSDDDAFLHLAYERSIDKNWVSAAWSDPLGIVTYTKSWCNSASLLKSTNSQATSNSNGHGDVGINRNVHDLYSISDQILEISNDLFKKLNDEIIKRTSGLGGRKFLVLTRVNSIIPDDELVHWKRLSVKYKDISLIVLSVNGTPKASLTETTITSDGIKNGASNLDQSANNDLVSIDIEDGTRDLITEEGMSRQGIKMDPQESANDFFKNFNNMSSSNNPSPNNSNLMISPSNNFSFGLNNASNFLSPDVQGVLGGQTQNGDSSKIDQIYNGSFDLKDVTLQDPSDSIVGIVPMTSVPSLNTPTRPAMGVGYLLKKVDPLKPDYLIFDINLLSCSNYWNLKSLMKIILNHYKKLITLNDILCTRSILGAFGDEVERENYISSGIVPWHITAVRKSLNYLIHIDVEE